MKNEEVWEKKKKPADHEFHRIGGADKGGGKEKKRGKGIATRREKI